MNIYIDWNGHAPSNSKTGTMRNLLKPAKIVSFNEALLNEEIRYLKMVATEINKYPKHIVDNNVRQ